MRYQDYVIKDGKFVGNFEKMYQEFDDPWHEKKKIHFTSMSRRSVCYYIDKFNIKSIVEFGCGLGHTSNYLKENTNVEILGVDISETAIKKSKEYFPHIKFKVDNVRNISNYADYECIYFAEITWYILEDKMIDVVFNRMKQEFKGKYFINNSIFYKDGLQKYGRDYFTNLKEFIDFCPFECIGKVEIDMKGNVDSVETSSIFRI